MFIYDGEVIKRHPRAPGPCKTPRLMMDLSGFGGVRTPVRMAEERSNCWPSAVNICLLASQTSSHSEVWSICSLSSFPANTFWLRALVIYHKVRIDSLPPSEFESNKWK